MYIFFIWLYLLEVYLRPCFPGKRKRVQTKSLPSLSPTCLPLCFVEAVGEIESLPWDMVTAWLAPSQQSLD